MNLEQLRKQLEIDEGVKYEIYLDHLGLPTFGIGHLVIKTDAESGQDVGTSISEERVRECFEADVLSVIKDCNKLYENFDELPEEVQQIIANMMFNMGLTRLRKFKGMKRGVDSRRLVPVGMGYVEPVILEEAVGGLPVGELNKEYIFKV